MSAGSRKPYPASSIFPSSLSSASAVQGSSCIRMLAPEWSWSSTFSITASGLFFVLESQSSDPFDQVV
ncbi:Protein of unknown function [Thermobacillus xylanilyticus]|uniref:Uncharacterized protein n=1 Tax=Thermobacillus xylanilyticus TaxID=76633 RepID=A0ABM8V530_THEXY|nr:Protein of unknown function [Thermobacillus xylanilyticus]